MGNISKAKGTKYETAIVNAFNDWVGEQVCERIVLHGNKDQGDIRLDVDDMTICIEAKWRKSQTPPAVLQEFKRQTVIETHNSKSDGGLLVLNKFRSGVMSSLVYMTKSTYLKIHGADRLLNSDELTDRLRGRIEQLLSDDDEHDWVCLSLLDLCWTLYGAPAWGMEELN